MHLLYVTDFVVTAAETALDEAPFDLLVRHTADWLSRGQAQALHVEALTTSGSATLATGHDGEPRTAAWSLIEVQSTRVLLVEVVQDVAAGVTLKTRLTIGDLDGVVSFRAGISRESQRDSAISPVGFTPVFQPGIVGAIAKDPNLQLHSGGQEVSEKYLQLPSPQFVDSFAEILDNPRRLPILLVHTRTQRGWNFAREVAMRLVGLVRVVTLANYSRSRLAALRPDLEVPYGGARLVWSDARAPGPTWSEDRVLTSELEDLRASVMRSVAPLSALYRGTDQVWQDARRRAQQLEAEQLADRVSAARGAVDQSELIAALQNQVIALRSERDDFRRLADEYARDADSLRDQALQLETTQADAKYWREQYFQTQSRGTDTEADLWSAVPPLSPGTDPSLTFRAIEAAAEGRIVFTPSASSSWCRVDYPEPADMLTKLLALANAAVDLYGEDPGTIGRIDDWFKTRHGLNTSISDDTIQKTKSFRYFRYQGKRYDQTPHVKVRDGVKPNNVGRIHFAMDDDNKRFLVNHVALKLYGI